MINRGFVMWDCDDGDDPNAFYLEDEWYDELQADADWCEEQRESAGEDV